MSTRTSSVAALLLLAACSSEASVAPPPDDPDRIACALAGAAAFARDCWVEQHPTGASALQLVVRHPDGGFRVFDVLSDGHGLATADGADAAQVALADGGIEVTVDRDRYRFPATIAGHEPR